MSDPLQIQFEIVCRYALVSRTMVTRRMPPGRGGGSARRRHDSAATSDDDDEDDNKRAQVRLLSPMCLCTAIRVATGSSWPGYLLYWVGRSIMPVKQERRRYIQRRNKRFRYLDQ